MARTQIIDGAWKFRTRVTYKIKRVFEIVPHSGPLYRVRAEGLDLYMYLSEQKYPLMLSLAASITMRLFLKTHI